MKLINYKLENQIVDDTVFSRAITLNPKLAEAYYNRGLAYGIKGDIVRQDFQRGGRRPRLLLEEHKGCTGLGAGILHKG